MVNLKEGILCRFSNINIQGPDLSDQRNSTSEFGGVKTPLTSTSAANTVAVYF